MIVPPWGIRVINKYTSKMNKMLRMAAQPKILLTFCPDSHPQHLVHLAGVLVDYPDAPGRYDHCGIVL